MNRIVPSILAADFNRLGEQLKQLEESGIEAIHVDVMDGLFVPSISFGMPVISSIRKETRLFFDVHLMVSEAGRYTKEFVEAGADSITVHVEACEDVSSVLSDIRNAGVKVGISINPDTPVDKIREYLPVVDLVLVMSVHPGFGGQKLIPETLEKVKELKNIRQNKNLCYTIEVDGGVNEKTVADVIAMGADTVVAGTAVFKGDIKENVNRIREVIENAS